MRSEAANPFAVRTLSQDSWLTAIFGLPVWRLENGGGGVPLSELEKTVPVFAYAKCDASRVGEISWLTDFGFRVVDAALTLEGVVGPDAGSRDDRVRHAVPADRDAVRDIAGRAFRFSRFHLDPLVPDGVADAIKASWAENFFAGRRGDGMVVAEAGGRVVGFLQLIWGEEDRLLIDLIGVAPEHQGQGLGHAMICHAAKHGTGDHRIPSGILVGTQAANVPSMRLYESLGLRLRSAQYVLHYHGAAVRLGNEDR